MIWNPGICAREGIGTEGVGGVLAILFKVTTNWFEQFTSELKLIHHILFTVVGIY